MIGGDREVFCGEYWVKDELGVLFYEGDFALPAVRRDSQVLETVMLTSASALAMNAWTCSNPF